MDKPSELNLDRIVFIGRTYAEYMKMFDLDEALLREGQVLDCPAGPSSFTAEARDRGFSVTACDVLYDTPPGSLEDKGRKDIEHTYRKVDDVPHLYLWDEYTCRDEIMSLRRRALERFLDDYLSGTRNGRYIRAELPQLPFRDRTFNIVLSSHFLFLYGGRLSVDFHVSSLSEMMRVSSGGVRVYPLQGLDAKPYPHMDDVLYAISAKGIRAEIAGTPFEFQRGANKMLKLRWEADP